MRVNTRIRAGLLASRLFRGQDRLHSFTAKTGPPAAFQFTTAVLFGLLAKVADHLRPADILTGLRSGAMRHLTGPF